MTGFLSIFLITCNFKRAFQFFRDRQQHLAIFLNHMHPFLMKQQIEYGIFVIEQEGNLLPLEDFFFHIDLSVYFFYSDQMIMIRYHTLVRKVKIFLEKN